MGLVLALLVVALARPVYPAGGAGVCAECHEAEAGLSTATGGHAPGLECHSCHADRRPGRFGRHHRAIASCATHHRETRHPPRARGASRPIRNCLVCHDVHGSPNLHLVREQIRSRPRRLSEVALENESGAARGGFTDPADPGMGVCEVCHRGTKHYRADGHGTVHFTETCTLCHEHLAGFQPVVSDKNCTICHSSEGTRFAKTSLHSARFVCSGCHAETAAAPGPGHRVRPACTDCHANRTHAPPGQAPLACTQCHDPHGTDNAKLVVDVIGLSQGGERPIRFDNLLGRVDGSFAGASAPGTGVCEVCHTTTRFYRADGSGADHFPFSCLPCHLHANGFTPG